METSPSALGGAFARELQGARVELTARWLERIVDRVTVEPVHVFPMDDLLDHIPLLVDGIARFVGDPAQTVAAQADVIDKAMELGALRFAQGFSEHELQKEYEILGGVLFTFLSRVASEHTARASSGDTLACAHRLFQAIALIQQATTTQFLRHMTAQLSEREQRLQAFHRALTHEIRNRIGATLGAGQLLTLPGLDESKREELAGVVVRNANGMRAVLENLLELARGPIAPRQQRHVLLSDAIAEAARQLRDTAARQGVVFRIIGEHPGVEVNAAAVELCLTNLFSNAIKYASTDGSERWAEVRAYVVDTDVGAPAEVAVEVRDNGRGVPPEARARLFERFFRAHEQMAPQIEGTGLGLSIVREIVEGLGGRVWAEFPENGTVIGFTLPARRRTDRDALCSPVPPPLAIPDHA